MHYKYVLNINIILIIICWLIVITMSCCFEIYCHIDLCNFYSICFRSTIMFFVTLEGLWNEPWLLMQDNIPHHTVYNKTERVWGGTLGER